ncbi:MAG: alpha/beta fold hydrolase [Spirochaetes bacterium]|nr:alpha/beta fold hydrolase [Spirochaetota bacterium]
MKSFFRRITPSAAIGITIAVCLVFATSCVSVQIYGDKHAVQTKDDWQLTIEHFAPLSAAKRKYPILICHGLGANRQYFKAKDEDSLVRNLQRAGYDVWLMDLRGRADAGETGYWFGKHTYTYSMDEYVKYDLDAAIGYVLAQTGAAKVSYIGHSMGGIVMHARLGSIGDERVANFIAIASPMSFLPYNKQTFNLYRMRQGMVILPVIPLRPGAIMGSFFPEFLYAPFMNAFLNPENTDGKVKTMLMQRAINNIAKPEIKQFIYMTEHGGMFSTDGTVSYRDNLSKIKIPVYLLAARRDELADPAVVRDAYERVGSKDKTFEIFSRADGYIDDYGHTDLIIGKEAHVEVHPKIVEWLNKRS